MEGILGSNVDSETLINIDIIMQKKLWECLNDSHNSVNSKCNINYEFEKLGSGIMNLQ